MLTRRALLLGGSASLVASTPRPRDAYARKPAPPPRLVVPVAIAIAQRTETVAGKAALVPVVPASFVEDQLAETNAIFGEHAVGFVEHAARRTLPEGSAKLETRADRDALADSMLAGVANVFVVESLRDVDDPARFRMGVCWRKLSNLSKRYVIVAASALPSTLAHELGHFLGNGHASVKNNLMSYQRDGGKVFLDQAQARRSRATIERLVAQGELARVEA